MILATQAPTRRMAPLTQSAALMVENTVYSTKYRQLDTLLDGGIKQGFILELSGPPGCLKETIAINVVSSFVEASRHVLFVGRISPMMGILRILTWSDRQNMTSPATLVRALRSTCVIKSDVIGMTYSHAL